MPALDCSSHVISEPPELDRKTPQSVYLNPILFSDCYQYYVLKYSPFPLIIYVDVGT